MTLMNRSKPVFWYSNQGGPPLLPGFHLHKPSEYIYFHRTSGMPALVFFIVADGTVSAMVSGCRK